MTRRELLLSLLAVPAALLVPAPQQGFFMAGIKDFPMFTARPLPQGEVFMFDEDRGVWETKPITTDNPY